MDSLDVLGDRLGDRLEDRLEDSLGDRLENRSLRRILYDGNAPFVSPHLHTKLFSTVPPLTVCATKSVSRSPINDIVSDTVLTVLTGDQALCPAP